MFSSKILWVKSWWRYCITVRWWSGIGILELWPETLRVSPAPVSGPSFAWAQGCFRHQWKWINFTQAQIRVNHALLSLAQLGSVSPHALLRPAQSNSATAQHAYSWLTLHPCVTQAQNRKEFLCGSRFHSIIFRDGVPEYLDFDEVT